MVLWIGAMGFFLFVFAPAVHGLPPGSSVPVLDKGRKSFEILSWIAITLLLLTGSLNLTLRSMESGLPSGEPYSFILAVKLLLFLAMFFQHFLQVFKVAPKIASLTAQTAQDIPLWPEPLVIHWKRWFLLLKINVTLGPVVLFLGLVLSRG